jgi:hypothetical protein
LSEFWLSATGTPWLVVSTWPAASARTRSSVPIVAFSPGSGPSPTLGEAFFSLSVLPVVSAEVWRHTPATGLRAASPYSFALVAFDGMDFASASLPASFRPCASSAGGLREGPLTVLGGVRFCGGLRDAMVLLPVENVRVLARSGPKGRCRRSGKLSVQIAVNVGGADVTESTHGLHAETTGGW